MPLILEEKDPKFGKTFLWSVTEDEPFFKDALNAAGFEIAHIGNWHPKRRLEWLSGRYLIHKYMDASVTDLKVDEFGKPFLTNSPYNLSISHTKGLVGLQYHITDIGLDLQIETDKIHRVAHKFCTKDDYTRLGVHYNTKQVERITWSLKEAVFKAYGKGNLSYRDHILLKQVTKHRKTILEIAIKKDSFQKTYMGRVSMIGPYCMTQVYQVSG